MNARTINAILTHQSPAEIERMLKFWSEELTGSDVLVVYGGPEAGFAEVPGVEKVFVEGDGHRPKHRTRDRQSYAGVLRAISGWLQDRDYQFVNLLEYDVVPLSARWPEDLEEIAEQEGADLLCHWLQRVDGTLDIHYLCHADDPDFGQHWRKVSCREDTKIVLSMLGCHCFWRRRALEEVAARPEPVPTYLEMQLPTLAHHLGFRVRPIPNPGRLVRDRPSFPASYREEAAGKPGALALHPVKGMWSQP